MIPFRIAKRLKDAGFPQRFHGSTAFNEDGLTVRLVADRRLNGQETGVSIPSLNELIKACGETFGGLEHFPRETRNRFRAFTQPPEVLSGYGETSEEAAARLWLVRNKR